MADPHSCWERGRGVRRDPGYGPAQKGERSLPPKLSGLGSQSPATFALMGAAWFWRPWPQGGCGDGGDKEHRCGPSALDCGSLPPGAKWAYPGHEVAVKEEPGEELCIGFPQGLAEAERLSPSGPQAGKRIRRAPLGRGEPRSLPESLTCATKLLFLGDGDGG